MTEHAILREGKFKMIKKINTFWKVDKEEKMEKREKREKIKKLTYSIIFFAIMLSACGRQDQADAKQLEQINEQVENLHNKEMTDLAESVSVEVFKEIEESLQAVDEAALNEANRQTFEQIEGLYQNALEMYILEEDINELFVGDSIEAKVQQADITLLSTRLAEINQEKWTRYIPRQKEKLVEAEEQLKKIKVATDLVEQFYLDEGRVTREVKRDEENITKEAIDQVKNQKIREELKKLLEKVDQTLTKAEEEQRQAIDGVGLFEGMYLSSDNFILYIDEKQHFVAENEANDNVVYYEVTEIINNNGNELTLGLYEKPIPSFGIEGGNSKATFYLSDDHNTIITERGFEFERLTQAEIDKILEELSGIKSRLEGNRN